MNKELISERKYKAGYIVREEQSTEWGPGVIMKSAYTPEGLYIGDSKTAYFLCKKRGIKPEKARKSHNICSIGFCEGEQKWYGWSHRAVYGFGVGDTVKEGDCAASSGWTDEYLTNHPGENTALPVGFTALTLADAKTMAKAFAASVG